MGLVNPLNDVFFWDTQTGWAVGEKGTILHTDNGGATWQRQISPVEADLRRVDFLDVQSGWIAGVPQRIGGWRKNVLLHTEDGGSTWMESPLPISASSVDIDFTWADAHTGWLIFDIWGLHTTDGGQTWQKQSLPLGDHRPTFITSVDSQHAWIATDGIILRTTDGGETWIALDTGLDSSIETVTFVDRQTGWAFSERGDIAHTVDGGQTWQEQRSHMALIRDADFLDASRGWALSRSRLWFTMDGGLTWEVQDVPRDRRAFAFVDAQHGWAVGSNPSGWRTGGERTTIAYTDDGGAIWQIQDLNIEMPPLAYTSAAHLTAYLTQPDPPLEVLLVRLFQGSCGLGWKYESMETILGNLGWDGTGWSNPSVSIKSSLCESWHCLEADFEADLDGDGEDEIVLYGEVYPELFVGVLDWDGTQWQVAWLNFFPFYHGGKMRVQIDDFNTDGRLELLVEMVRSGHTGYFRDFLLARCSHLSCRSVWEPSSMFDDAVVGGFHEGYTYSSWSGSDYRFVDIDGDTQLEIELQRCGMSCKVAEDERGLDVPGTLEAELMTTTQIIYRWDGTHYTPTIKIVLEPGYVLDTSTTTETVDLDGDGTPERVVSRWERDYWRLQQTLSTYIRIGRESWQPSQVFTATVIDSSAGVALRDADGDGRIEVVRCTSLAPLTITLDTWPSRIEPCCITYYWDLDKSLFVAITGHNQCGLP